MPAADFETNIEGSENSRNAKKRKKLQTLISKFREFKTDFVPSFVNR
jgi:hypothetical protein